MTTQFTVHFLNPKRFRNGLARSYRLAILSLLLILSVTARGQSISGFAAIRDVGCLGESYSFTATVSGYTNVYSYTLTDGVQTTISTSNSPNFDVPLVPTTTGLRTVTLLVGPVTSSGGGGGETTESVRIPTSTARIASPPANVKTVNTPPQSTQNTNVATVGINVLNPPSLTVTASPSFTITSGQTVTLTASGADSYTWTGGATGSSFTATPASTTPYSVTGANAGCSSTTTVTVTVTGSPFVTRWNLATTGSGANQLSFGVATSGTVSYTWQEVSPGSASGSGTFTGTTATITGLPTGATIDLSIAPANFQRIIINNGADRSRLIDVRQWGTVGWTSMNNAFYGCDGLAVSASDVPNLAGVSDMTQMFRGCTSLNGPANIGSWNTANVTNMSFMFYGARAFNQNIGSWNTAKVTTMNQMFRDASVFNQNIGSWNTANVIIMHQMFLDARAFNQNIGSWNTAKVTTMSGMFLGASAFNQNIGSWNTANVTDMYQMFSEASAFNQNIGSWNTAKVTTMYRMFWEARAFNQNIGLWNTANVTNMSGMFLGASAFNQNIGSWNTGNVTNMSLMFWEARAFNQNIGSWNTANVTTMSFMFYGARAFNQSLSDWGTRLNPAVDLASMLDNCGMSVANYDATLTGFNSGTVTGRNLGATGRQYCASAADRANLTGVKGWTISGDLSLVPNLMVTANPSLTITSGQTVTLTASGGTSYTWTGGATARSFTATPASTATYSVTSVNASGCMSVTSVTVTVNAPPAPTITAFAPTAGTVCVGSVATFTATLGNVTGTYDFTLTNGTGPISGTATGAAFSRTLTTAGSGVQTFTLTIGANGTTVAASTTLNVGALPVAGINASLTALSCSNPTVSLTATGGNMYRWEDGSTNASRTISASGTYSVTVTSSNVCSATASITLNDEQIAPVANILPVGPALSCTGTASLTATGGVSYRWDDSSTNPVRTVYSEGLYSVTVTAANGCTATASTTVALPFLVLPQIEVTPLTSELSCVNTSVTLTASIVVGFGSGYTFRWEDNSTGATRIVTSPGTYRVTVTWDNGCFAMAEATVTGSTSAHPDYQPLVDLYNSTNGPGWTNKTGWLTNCDPCNGWFGVTCAGGRVTRLLLTDNKLIGSIPSSLSALISLQDLRLQANQLSGSIPSGLSALTNLQRLDLDNNQLSGSIPSSLSALINLQRLFLQNNQLTGSIPNSLSALTSLQQLFLINNQLSGNIPSSLSALTNLQDLRLSSNQLSGSIPNSLSVLTNLQLLLLSENQLTGSIPSSLSALTSLLQLRLDRNQLTGSIPNSLSALTSLQLLLLNNNQLTGNIPASLSALINLQDLWLHNNQFIGSIPSSLSALTNLSSLNLNDNQLSGCYPASLTFFCEITTNFSNNIGLPGGGSTASFSAFCASGEGSDAFVAVASASQSTATVGTAVSLSSTGGSTATFSWLAPAGATLGNSATGSTVSATLTTPGEKTFTVTVSFGNSCSSVATVSVTGVAAAPPAPTITAFAPTAGTVCVGSVATFTATVGNVTGTYNFTLTNSTGTLSSTATGATFSQPLTTAGSGVQTFTLTIGANGTTVAASTTLNVEVLTANISPSSTTLTCSSPTATFTASGGGTYRWEDGSTNAIRSVSTAGTYSVTVTAANGCTATASVTISEDKTLPAVSLSASGTVTCANPTVTLTASPAGQGTYRFTGPGLNQSGAANTATVSAGGVYGVTVTAANGCTVSATTTVESATNAVNATLVASGTLTCANPTVTLTASPAGASYTFSGPGLSQSGATNTATVSTAGTYSVVVTAAGGCSAVSTVTVQGNTTPPTANITPTAATLTCSNPTATLTASGGGTYRWEDGSTNASRTVNSAGTYSVTVTSANGCTATASVTISEDKTLPTFSLAASGTVTCANPTVTLTASPAGQGTYRFTGPGLNQSGAANTATVAAGGVYGVTVTAANGCTASATTTVESATNAVNASLVASGTLTCANPTVTLTASPAGASFVFSGPGLSQSGATNTATVSAAGTYSVTVTAAGGCSAVATVTVEASQELPTVSISANPGSAITQGQTVTLTASGATAYRWSTGATTPAINPPTSATGSTVYSVTGTSPNGCSATAQITLVVSASLTPPPTGVCGSQSGTLGGPLTLLEPIYNCATGQIQFRTSGGNGAPITYAAIGITGPTTSCSATVDAQVAVDIRNGRSNVEPFTILATQGNVTVSYRWNALAACAGTPPPPTNTPPTVANSVGAQLATVGVGYSLNIGNVFTDAQTPAALTLSASGLPVGLTLVGSTITGTPSASGVSTVTLTATDPGGMSSSTSFVLTVNPAGSTTPPVGAPLAATVVSYSCQTGAITFGATGGNGSPVEYFAIGITGWTTNVNGMIEAGLRADPKPVTIRVRQNGVEGTPFMFDFGAFCRRAARLATETLSDLDVLVLGNPSTENDVVVEIANPAGEALQLRVISTQGRQLTSQWVAPTGQPVRQRVSLGSESGIYLLQVSTPNRTKTVKVVRQ
ncbi:BspA family leucine-rich repeat surface protein [Rudanella paleaurantiibacter]|uniref:BspA family leucine-rich repeat surface protein n=1 Tax=Rudanella paleaurantiibacter TaxID=2614655 RepID=A0A7J5TT89_9BACT|nr:BspA family leucine-rich repeat surface protein [Rudanella paleaurantiibacter]KAB7726872.1 BspA family leucine-rich repeat surface protein [Rudanella paleaurantiibacter]